MRELRMTPARNSILSGGQPFKEVTSSGKKFNSRRKANRSGHLSRLNDTVGSNETFIDARQELVFDRDSLDTNPPSSLRRQRISSTPKPMERAPAPVIAKPVSKLPVVESTSKFKAPRVRPIGQAAKPRQQTKQQPKPFNRYVTPRHLNVSTRHPDNSRSSFMFKRPMLCSTPGQLTRSQSFKSTAELERDYFNSLRSRM